MDNRFYDGKALALNFSRGCVTTNAGGIVNSDSLRCVEFCFFNFFYFVGCRTGAPLAQRRAGNGGFAAKVTFFA